MTLVAVSGSRVLSIPIGWECKLAGVCLLKMVWHNLGSPNHKNSFNNVLLLCECRMECQSPSQNPIPGFLVMALNHCCNLYMYLIYVILQFLRYTTHQAVRLGWSWRDVVSGIQRSNLRCLQDVNRWHSGENLGEQAQDDRTQAINMLWNFVKRHNFRKIFKKKLFLKFQKSCSCLKWWTCL